MNTESILKRRQFLKKTTIFGGLTALLSIVRPAAARPKEPRRQPEPSGQGYQLTEHVKKYYETARL